MSSLKTMSKSNRLVVLGAATWLAMGIIDGFFFPVRATSPLAFAYGLVLASVVYQWFHAHTKERDTEAPLGTSVLAAYLPLIGIPLYFFWCLPARAAISATLKAAALLVGLLCIYGLSASIAKMAKAALYL